jgi:hypothetical protein
MEICYCDNKTSNFDSVVYPARGDGWDYWLQQSSGAYYTYVTTCDLTREEKNMRKLYEVFVVDPEIEEIKHCLVIAKSASGAKHKAMRTLGLTKDYDDYDMEADEVMTLRKEKEVQSVRIVRDGSSENDLIAKDGGKTKIVKE